MRRLELTLRVVLSFPEARPLIKAARQALRCARPPRSLPPEPIVTTGETVDRRVADRRCA